MRMTRTKADIMIMLITVIWGLSFILIKVAINNNMSPGMINLIRGGLFAFLALIFFYPKIVTMSRHDAKVGLIIGGFNFLGFTAQTVGAIYTTPSKNAFLTVTSVVIVPFIVWIMYKRRPAVKTFLAIALCMYGMTWLTGFLRVSMVLNLGDFFSILCAFFFAMAIALLSNTARECEFGVIAFWMGVCHFIGGMLYFFVLEKGEISLDINWLSALIPVIFLGLFGSFLAQTGQVYAQRFTTATAAALIMTLEGVFGSIFSVIFGFDKMDWSLVIGGSLIMLSLLVSEYDFRKGRLHKSV